MPQRTHSAPEWSSTEQSANAALSDLGKSFSAGAFHPNLEVAGEQKSQSKDKELDVIVLLYKRGPIPIK